jgi:hypothetical protein
LKIEASTDRPVYKPGEDARIAFRVTNDRGEGVQAALGVQVVDEAVFALAEKQPGFAKVFFYLEQEALKPGYEIHSIERNQVVEPVPTAQRVQRDLAARALFSATEMVAGNRFQTEVGRTVPQTKLAQYRTRYQTRFETALRDVASRLNGMEAAAVKSRIESARDAWLTNLRMDRFSWGPRERYFSVTSAGPDKKFRTGDDAFTNIKVWRGRVTVNPPLYGNELDIDIEPGRGPNNGLASVVGSVNDAAGRMFPRAT